MDPKPPRRDEPAPRGRRLLALEVALILLAYRGLLDWRGPGDSLSLELERWFFVPSGAGSGQLLVLLPALWLLYRRVGRLRSLPPQAGPRARAAALLLFALGLAACAWATLTGAAHLLALSLMFHGFGIASWRRGPAGARAVALPLAFLLFAVPLPPPLLNELAFRLQLWTAEYAGWLLYALGEPALVSADQILRQSARFAVIENCSGLRSIETLLMLAVLMADLFRRPAGHGLALLLAAPLVGFALNGVRVVTLILNPHSELAAVHNAQGVAILLAGLVCLYGLDGLFERLRAGRGGGGEAAAAARAAPAGASTGRPAGGWRRWLPTAVLAATAAVSLLAPTWPRAQATALGVHLWIPERLDGRRAVERAPDATFLGTIALRESLLRSYRNGGAPVDLFLAVGDHGRGVRGPFSPKTAVPGSGWIVEREEPWPLAGRERPVTARVCRRGPERRLVLHWYEGWAGLGPELLRSLLALDESPWPRRRAGLVVRLETPLTGLGEEPLRRARERLERFHADLAGPLERLGELARRRKSFS